MLLRVDWLLAFLFSLLSFCARVTRAETPEQARKWPDRMEQAERKNSIQRERFPVTLGEKFPLQMQRAVASLCCRTCVRVIYACIRTHAQTLLWLLSQGTCNTSPYAIIAFPFYGRLVNSTTRTTHMNIYSWAPAATLNDIRYTLPLGCSKNFGKLVGLMCSLCGSEL